MDDGIAAVRLQFPDRAETIDERASWDSVFCEICRDFAEVQAELGKWAASSDPQRDERCAEYRELLAGLGKEIEDTLDKAKVVPLHHPPVPRSR